MHLPLNAIHWYIGFPILFFVGIRAITLYAKNKNILNKYLGISSILFCLCFLVYGMPALFFIDGFYLTISTIAGDIIQYVALFFMWLAVARVYFPKIKTIRIIIISADIIIIVIASYYSVINNLSYPVTISQSMNGSWNINYFYSGWYQIFSAIQYASLLLIAAYFLSQARNVKDKIQKFRLIFISLTLFVIGAVYLFQPIISVSPDFTYQTLIITGALLIMGIFLAGTIFLSYKKNN